ncbi:hypothetical protein [Hyphomicrobium sp. D-2]|uniref:hypothetical protein n=1 Tax=Hyphomicrobium sp. D-2 TaxID=3041621 RepID=UPI002453E4A1|nr:hypothetical protein [Hyphomicrobium sp. D-2]MDH4981780.1 hypothetical protein [Hyphomicrobium sp. D-2]
MPSPLAKPTRSQTGYLPLVLSLGMLLLALVASGTANPALAQTPPAAATNGQQQQPAAAPAQPVQQPQSPPPAIAPTPGAATVTQQQIAPTASPPAPAAAPQAPPVASDPAQQPHRSPAAPQGTTTSWTG